VRRALSILLVAACSGEEPPAIEQAESCEVQQQLHVGINACSVQHTSCCACAP
jgi:hypothetical protein